MSTSNKVRVQPDPTKYGYPDSTALNAIMELLNYLLPHNIAGQIEPKDAVLRKGMLAYADGTNWNPGSGEGLYRYNGSIWNTWQDAGEQAITCADTVTIDFSLGATAYMVLDRATTAITLSNGYNGKVYRIRLTQDNGGSRAATWSTTVKWKGGSAPTLTSTGNKSDWITLIKSGNDWYGDIIKNF